MEATEGRTHHSSSRTGAACMPHWLEGTLYEWNLQGKYWSWMVAWGDLAWYLWRQIYFTLLKKLSATCLYKIKFFSQVMAKWWYYSPIWVEEIRTYISAGGTLEVCKWNLQINENGGLRGNHSAYFPAVTVYLNNTRHASLHFGRKWREAKHCVRTKAGDCFNIRVILVVYPIYIKKSYLRLRIKMTSSSYGRLDMFNVHLT